MKKKTIVICLTLLILFGVGAYWLLVPERGEKMVTVSGSVVDPLTRTPVFGVDLVVSDTSIRTGESGRFVFTGVGTKTGIRLTHPELLRALVLLPQTRTDEQELEVLFNIPLLNALITIIDFEARGNIDAVYDHLAPQIKGKLTRKVFREEFESMFVEEDITNQEIVIRGMRRVTDYYNRQLDLRFSNIIEFELVNGDDSKWYALIYHEEVLGSQWQFIF